MTTILERRIEVLERGAHAEDTGLVIVRQIVSPGDLEPQNSFCQIDGVAYTRADDESPADFDARMLGLVEDRCRQVGHPVRLVRGATNLHG